MVNRYFQNNYRVTNKINRKKPKKSKIEIWFPKKMIGGPLCYLGSQ
jgi:hypothetical protein